MDKLGYCDGGDDNISYQNPHHAFESLSSKNVRENRLAKK